MVHADQRGCFGESVSLNCRVPQTPPELFGFGVQRRTAGDEGEELPSEPAPDCAKDPPTMQEVLVFCFAESFLECRHFPAVFEIAFYLLLQRLEHTRDADQDRNALPTNGFDHLRGFQFLLKDHGASQQRRQEHAQKLAKDVAEGQQIQKAQGMHEALILQIPLHLALEWGSVRQNVSMSDHDALRCSRRARGEYNLEDVAGMENDGRNFVSGSRRQFLKDQS